MAFASCGVTGSAGCGVSVGAGGDVTAGAGCGATGERGGNTAKTAITPRIVTLPAINDHGTLVAAALVPESSRRYEIVIFGTVRSQDGSYGAERTLCFAECV